MNAAGEAIDEQVRQAAAAALHCPVTDIEPMAGGLGLRRFFRVRLDTPPGSETPRTVVARVEAPEDPAGRPDGIPPEPLQEPLRRFLQERGLPVPRHFGGAPRHGVDLLEDLGTRTLEQAVRDATPERRSALYRQAVDIVPRLQSAKPDASLPAFRRHLDADLFAYKGELFLRESLASASGGETGPAQAEVVRRAFHWISEVMTAAPQRLAHRDFQSQNLHVCDAGPGAHAAERIVMVDFQGAFLAPPEYDLVCLLRDSYVELPEDEVRAQLERVRPSLPDRPSAEELRLRFDLLTLTRKGKDHARFLYAARERADTRFLQYVPATVRALRGAASRCAGLAPCLADLAELIFSLPESPCAR